MELGAARDLWGAAFGGLRLEPVNVFEVHPYSERGHCLRHKSWTCVEKITRSHFTTSGQRRYH